jgi:hypothetical protein
MIESHQAEQVRSGTIIRSGSVTYLLKTDQRCIGLEIADTKEDEIIVKMLNNSNTAPSWYDLVLI